MDLSHLNSYPLPEDVELQCFLPLSEAHEHLDFSKCVRADLQSFDGHLRNCQLDSHSHYIGLLNFEILIKI